MLTHRDRRGTKPRPKIGPPLRGRPQKAAGYVERLVRATSPAFAALLAGGLMRAIPTIAGIEHGPWELRKGHAAGDSSAPLWVSRWTAQIPAWSRRAGPLIGAGSSDSDGGILNRQPNRRRRRQGRDCAPSHTDARVTLTQQCRGRAPARFYEHLITNTKPPRGRGT